jgi:hypothetical protein
MLTADNLALLGCPHYLICKLCGGQLETIHHLILDCTSTIAVCEKIFEWKGSLGVVPPPLGDGINGWWDTEIVGIPKERRREASGAIIYTKWETWKERNGRVFHGALLPKVVAHLVWEEIAQKAYTHT